LMIGNHECSLVPKSS